MKKYQMLDLSCRCHIIWLLLHKFDWLQSIFVLLVSFNLLPPWATMVATLVSIKDVIRNIGYLFINSKSSTNMKETTYKTKQLNGVWNTVGSVG